jgi:rubrerythrin
LRDAESTHVKLFQQALDNFEHTKKAESFHVCPRCGAVTRSLAGGPRIGCGSPAESFLIAS